jgi:uncharacterized protein YaiI (UPF0178 family)
LLKIFIDADACPVKQETYRVAKRYGLQVTLVANSWMQTPHGELVELVVVGGKFDEADDWIVEQIGEDDIAITADIPLAGRCLEKGAQVLGPKGRPFTEESIGDALATRELMSQLRDMGAVSGGPAPFAKQDRSNFLQGLDKAIQAIRHRHRL